MNGDFLEGSSIPVPTECPACHSTHLRMAGAGTERIEEDLQILFPDATVARMDLDSTLQKNQYIELPKNLSPLSHPHRDYSCTDIHNPRFVYLLSGSSKTCLATFSIKQ